MKNASTLDRFFKLSLGFLACLCIGWFVGRIGAYLNGIVALFGIAFLMTYILLSPVNVAEALLKYCVLPLRQWIKPTGHRLTRVFSIVVVYVLLLFLAGFVSYQFLPEARLQLEAFAKDLPRYLGIVDNWLIAQPMLQGLLRLKPELHLMTLQSFSVLGPDNTTHTNQHVLHLLSSTLLGLVYFLTGLVLVFYFLLDGDKLKTGFVSLLPEDMQGRGEQILEDFHGVMSGFIKGQVLLGIVTGIYMVILYTLFGVPYAFFLGAFFAVAEILPVVGTWIGFTPGILVMLSLNPLKMLVVMGLVYIYQVIKDNMITPKIMGDVMGLHPVIVILSLLVCAKVGGLVGVLFAIPIASMANVLIRHMQDLENPTY